MSPYSLHLLVQMKGLREFSCSCISHSAMPSHCQAVKYSSPTLSTGFTAPNGRFAFVLRLQITIMPKQLLLTSICSSCLQQGTFICSIYFHSHFGLEVFLNKSITVDVGTGLLNNTQADYTHCVANGEKYNYNSSKKKKESILQGSVIRIINQGEKAFALDYLDSLLVLPLILVSTEMTF